jgi:hypothetical protein
VHPWSIEALAVAAETFKRCNWITMVHQRAYDARGAQSSSDGGVGGIEPKENRSLAQRPAAARICCSTTTQRHDAANAELCADRSGWRLR